jgi:hypothetical protein
MVGGLQNQVDKLTSTDDLKRSNDLLRAQVEIPSDTNQDLVGSGLEHSKQRHKHAVFVFYRYDIAAHGQLRGK